jgi:hypothetical protein
MKIFKFDENPLITFKDISLDKQTGAMVGGHLGFFQIC